MTDQLRTVKKFFLQGIYDPRINQGLWLSCATGVLYLFFFICEKEELAIFSVLAIFPSIIAKIDQPGPRFSLRLIKVISFFFVLAYLTLLFRNLAVPVSVIFFPLIFFCAMFSIYGQEAGGVGTAAMFVATLALSWPATEPPHYFCLLICFGALWYGISAKIWMLWWGHKVLRDILAKLFTAIGDYYSLKSSLLLGHSDPEKLVKIYSQQELVYNLVNQSKAYLNRYGEDHFDDELKGLKQTFLCGVDLMELLQANQYKLEEVREFIHQNELNLSYSDIAVAVVAALKKKAFVIRTRRNAVIIDDTVFLGLEQLLEKMEDSESSHVRSMRLYLSSLRRLLTSQKPVFERSLGPPETGAGLLATLNPHFNFRSPAVRYGLRLATTVASGLLLAELFALDNSYWIVLAILLVMQSGYLVTKTMITQRVLGTLAGVVLGLLLIQIAASGWKLVSLCLLTALFSFSMIFFHKILAITGVTTLVVLVYQLAFGSGHDVVFIRLTDSLIGCGLAFASNILLWPQWSGGGIKRLIKATLYAQEDILVVSIRALADKNIRREELTRRRLQLYTAQNNLLASYHQMLREPQHTHAHVTALEQVVLHFLATSAHINALLVLSREACAMPAELVRHMEIAAVTLFGRCDGEGEENEQLHQEELSIIYKQLEQVKEADHEPNYFAIVHLLELIYDRLNAIFEQLEFCTSVEK